MFQEKKMLNTITRANIVKKFEHRIFTEDKLLKFLQLGDLSDFETTLLEVFHEFYNNIVEFYLNEISSNVSFCHRLKTIARSHGLKKLSKRLTKLRIATGHYVYFPSYYAEKVPDDYDLSRFVVHDYFKTIDKTSPIYASRVTQLSVITPSFAVGKAVLDNFDCQSDTESNRQLSLTVGRKALINRAQNMLLPGETLAAKRVLIGIDGGRTRIREWDETTDADETVTSIYGTFNTPWKEPKLLVISSIDDKGKVNRKELPIYDVCFGDDEIFELLADYLAILQIDQARSVQIVGDGAPWIWLRAKPLLLKLGLKEHQIVETVDYFHAVAHLNDLEQYLPKGAQEATMPALKEQLWKGNIPKMKEILSEVLPDFEEKPLKPFNYFEKNQQRMKYEECRTQKLPIGSGIVESGIRRVINLRFKCPSAFWNLENLEPLFFLRAAFLAGRWNILMKNIRTF
jgi:hypothetical protein